MKNLENSDFLEGGSPIPAADGERSERAPSSKCRLSLPTSFSVKEGEIANIIVTKTGTGACSFSWRTQAVTATLDTDYTGMRPVTVSFADGEATKTLSVRTARDATTENPEAFEVIIGDLVNCTITTDTCRVTIRGPGASEEPGQRAYATAVGFASAADCGTGYPIYRVTTLADSGPGSLRSGVAAGNCMIVFEVGGRIVLNTDLTFGSNVTIAGETAPAPGITIQRKEFKIQSSNVRISHIIFEKGYDGDNLGNSDCGKVAPGSGKLPPSGTPMVTSNIHFYHCAFCWNMDESVEHWPSASRRIKNISYHDCIFTEALLRPKGFDSNLSNHDKVIPTGKQSCHNYGMLIGYGCTNFDIQYCLFSEFSWRCPRIDHSNSVVIANVIANNCGNGASIQQSPNVEPISVTVKGYLCISGPNTGDGPYSGLRWNSYPQEQPANAKFYASNLYGWKGGPATSAYITPSTSVAYDNVWGGNPIEFEGEVGKPYWLNGTTKVSVRVSAPPIDTPTPTVALAAQEIYDRALANVGPRPKERSNPSIVSNPGPRRTIDQLKSKTGKWVNHENEVGGFYKPAPVTRALDANTTFPDGAKPGAPPAQPQPPTPASRATMEAWLRKFLDQVQYD